MDRKCFTHIIAINNHILMYVQNPFISKHILSCKIQLRVFAKLRCVATRYIELHRIIIYFTGKSLYSAMLDCKWILQGVTFGSKTKRCSYYVAASYWSLLASTISTRIYAIHEQLEKLLKTNDAHNWKNMIFMSEQKKELME